MSTEECGAGGNGLRRDLRVDALSKLLSLPASEKTALGLLHTPAEIAQQPDTWLSTFDLFRTKRDQIAEFLKIAGVVSSPGPDLTVLLIGAGTSDYIGQSLAVLFRKRWGCEVIAVPSTDLLTHMDDFMVRGKRYLWISFSRSGDSPEGVAVIERARKRYPEIHHLVISCNKNGRMIRESSGASHAFGVCLDDGVNDRGLAMTSSFSNMVVFGQCLAHASELGGYEAVLQRLVNAGADFLPHAADCAAAFASAAYTKVCFVGSGSLRAVARESALKVMEMSAGKILTMSESVLGLRHGPMAALDQETLFVCFLSSTPSVQRYERDLLKEIGSKRLVRSRIVVGEARTSNNDSFAEHHLNLSETIYDEYRPAVDVIFGQLLGLFFSLRCNLQPDNPSPTGAISRVVQNVSIHS
jgi:tagatose-6-phosphate ketose/aldose isomerase